MILKELPVGVKFFRCSAVRAGFVIAHKSVINRNSVSWLLNMLIIEH